MKIEKLSEGQILYSAEKKGAGNTSMTTILVYRVRIKSIAEDKKSFMASWNGNTARKYSKVPTTWKVKKPIIVQNHFTSRLATKDEITTGTLKECPDYFTLTLPPRNTTDPST